MTVLILSACPAGLRGDVTKWLAEIRTGVYVGQINQRTREALWKRVCEYLSTGEATMVFTAHNEQGYSIYTHHTAFVPVDFDGLYLMKRPLPASQKSPDTSASPEKESTKKPPTPLPKPEKAPVSKTERPQKSKAPPLPYTEWHESSELPTSYTVIDLETTGLYPDENAIIEIGCVIVKNHVVVNEFHCLVNQQLEIPNKIIELTGITGEILDRWGIPLKEAIHQLIPFLHDNVLVGHYITFDISFLQAAFRKLEIEWQDVTAIDTRTLSKKLLAGSVENYQLKTLLRFFEIGSSQNHRALNDARLTMKLYEKLYEKLNEKQRMS